MESNHHEISLTRPSSVRVYQFRHVSFNSKKYTALLTETAMVLGLLRLLSEVFGLYFFMYKQAPL